MAGPRGIRSLATDWRGRVAFAASGGRVLDRVAGRLVRRPLLACRVALAAANTTIVYAGGACGAFRSDDAGRTFRRLPAAAGFPIRLVTASPAVHEAVARAEADLAGRGRVLLRPSGTEPVVRVMVEGEDRAHVQALAESIAAVVKATAERAVA